MITVTNLRKIFTEQGVKGASKWKREDFESTIIAAEFAAHAEDAARKPVVKHDRTGRTTTCTECGRKLKGQEFGGLCEADRTYGEWENTHGDQAHAQLIDSGEPVNQDQAMEIAECPVCHPELDPRKPVAKREGRSRAGMVIVAKGTELHKSQTFKVAAEAAGWTVTVQSETYELPEGTTGDGTRYYATATHLDGDVIQLAWDGRRYDYPSSSARIGGKDRKVRNLKEALRLLAA